MAITQYTFSGSKRAVHHEEISISMSKNLVEKIIYTNPHKCKLIIANNYVIPITFVMKLPIFLMNGKNGGT